MFSLAQEKGPHADGSLSFAEFDRYVNSKISMIGTLQEKCAAHAEQTRVKAAIKLQAAHRGMAARAVRLDSKRRTTAGLTEKEKRREVELSRTRHIQMMVSTKEAAAAQPGEQEGQLPHKVLSAVVD